MTETIEQLKAEIERLRGLVFYDELTGILNRRGFFKEAGNFFSFLISDREQERRIRPVTFFSVMFLDVDNFKSINDSFGHEVGDKVLVEVAQVVVNTVRGNDIVGRIGGEEFVAALPGADISVAQEIAERIRHKVETMNIPHLQGLCVTVSIGIVTRENEHELEELIKEADKAMYQAKQSGKNRVQVCYSE